MELFMRILKSIAFCLAAFSGTSEAFELHFAEGKECLMYQSTGYEEQFLFGPQFQIEHQALPEGLYGIKDVTDTPFGFFVIHPALPGGYFQACPEMNGDVVLSFEGNWSDIRFAIEFANGERDPFGNAEGTQKRLQNQRFDPDAKLVLTLNHAQLELKMPLIPTYGAHNPLEVNQLGPNTFVVQQSTPENLTLHVIPADQAVPAQQVTLQEVARFTAEESAAFWEMIRNLNPAYRTQKANEAAFRNYVRPQYPNLILAENARGGYRDDLISTQNAQNFAKWIHTELSVCPARYIEDINPLFLLDLIVNEDKDFFDAMRQQNTISQDQFRQAITDFLERCTQELTYHFSEAFIEVVRDKVHALARHTYVSYWYWLEQVNNVLTQFDTNGTYDKARIQALEDQYEALKNNHEVIGSTIQECAEKLFSKFKITGLEKHFVVNDHFLEELQNALEKALTGKGWGPEETVMNIKPIASTHHHTILNYLAEIKAKLGGEPEPFTDKHDLEAWLQQKEFPICSLIQTAVDRSELRNQPHLKQQIIHGYSDYDYMLFVASWVRYTCSLLEQSGKRNASQEVIGVFVSALKEQYRQCATGMVGRMFTVLVNVLSTLNQIETETVQIIHRDILRLEPID